MSDKQKQQNKPRYDKGGTGSLNAVAEIHAEGDVKIKIALIWVVGAILVSMTIGMILAFFFKTDNFKEYMIVISPLLSGSLFGFVGFIIGTKSKPPAINRG